MSDELRNLLRQADGGPASPPDHERIQRRGRRLIATRAAVAAAAPLLVIAGMFAVFNTTAREEPVILDQPELRGSLPDVCPVPGDPAAENQDTRTDGAFTPPPDVRATIEMTNIPDGFVRLENPREVTFHGPPPATIGGTYSSDDEVPETGFSFSEPLQVLVPEGRDVVTSHVTVVAQHSTPDAICDKLWHHATRVMPAEPGGRITFNRALVQERAFRLRGMPAVLDESPTAVIFWLVHPTTVIQVSGVGIASDPRLLQDVAGGLQVTIHE